MAYCVENIWNIIIINKHDDSYRLGKRIWHVKEIYTKYSVKYIKYNRQNLLHAML